MPITFPSPTSGPDTPQLGTEPASRRPDECEHECECECECTRADARDFTTPFPQAQPGRTSNPRGRKRLARQARFYAERLAQAHTPTERAAIAWERWRSLARHHNQTDTDQLADELFALIDQQITTMTPNC